MKERKQKEMPQKEKPMTRTEINQTISNYSRLIRLAEERLMEQEELRKKMTGISKWKPEMSFSHFDPYTVWFKCTDENKMGSICNINIKYLYEDNWKEDFIELMQESIRITEIEKKAEKLEKDKEDKELFLKLADRFNVKISKKDLDKVSQK